jgi:hypothetical protein
MSGFLPGPRLPAAFGSERDGARKAGSGRGNPKVTDNRLADKYVAVRCCRSWHGSHERVFGVVSPLNPAVTVVGRAQHTPPAYFVGMACAARADSTTATMAARVGIGNEAHASITRVSASSVHLVLLCATCVSGTLDTLDALLHATGGASGGALSEIVVFCLGIHCFPLLS